MIVSVMIAALGNQEAVFSWLVDQAMLVIDAAGPPAFELTAQGLWLSYAKEWCAQTFFDEGVDAKHQFWVRGLPMEVVLPCPVRENQFHSISALSVPPPASSSAMLASSRSAFFGFLSR